MAEETKYSKENYIDKIKGLLDRNIENGCTEAEAQTAMLLAQKLMAKHGIDMTDIEIEEKVDKEVVKDFADTGDKRNSWFETELAVVIADNFRCHIYLYGGKRIIFLGLKEDVEIAKMVFRFASTQALHYAKLYRKERKKKLSKESGLPDFSKMTDIDVVVFAHSLEQLEQREIMNVVYEHEGNPVVKKRVLVTLIKKRLGLSGDGAEIRNTYLKGFLSGLKEAFKEQRDEISSEYGLVLVKDKAVDDAYDDLELRAGRTRRVRTKQDAEAYAAGQERGKNFKTVSGEIE